MAFIDISHAQQPKRRRREGPAAETADAKAFRDQFPQEGTRYNWIQNQVLHPGRTTEVNPKKTEVPDWAALTHHIKAYALELGAEDVGIAEFRPEFTFGDAPQLPHIRVIAFAMGMKYDMMADIGPTSQTEVHRVYFKMLDVAVRLAQYIGSYGYQATAHPNGGELAHIPFAYLAGLGELGKHGSLISPKLGSSVRLALVSTDMPLVVDGPQDYGIDDLCSRCNLCTRFCPGEAISPEKQEVAGVTRWYVDTPKCEPYFMQLWGCKICLMVCPFNGRSENKEGYKAIAREFNPTKDAPGILHLLAEKTPEASDNAVLSKYL